MLSVVGCFAPRSGTTGINKVAMNVAIADQTVTQKTDPIASEKDWWTASTIEGNQMLNSDRQVPAVQGRGQVQA